MISAFITERCSDLPVSVCCRVMKVSTSGHYQRLTTPVTDRDWDEAHRANLVFDIWKRSRHSCGMPRIRREFRQGRHEGISRTTTNRLMRVCGAVGIHYKRKGGCTRPGDGELSDDLVNRAFDPDQPDRLWCMDITEHSTGEGKVYLAAALDAFSRRVIGWSIADHMRAELVADPLQMAAWRRQPVKGQTIAHADHGGQYTSVMSPDPPSTLRPRRTRLVQRRPRDRRPIAQIWLESKSRRLLRSVGCESGGRRVPIRQGAADSWFPIPAGRQSFGSQ
jgi:hypothetical protein